VWALLLLCAVLQEVRSADTVGPVLVHVITEKGRGYLPAETAQVGMQGRALHGPGCVLNIGGLLCAVGSPAGPGRLYRTHHEVLLSADTNSSFCVGSVVSCQLVSYLLLTLPAVVPACS
jgi:hypothetical protein